MLTKIISGGQTGADRAALDAAIKLEISHGGWIPAGRRTEDGPLPPEYGMQEMLTASYPKRTEKNVIDSDGTLILTHGLLTGGSKLTRLYAIENNRPYIHIDLLRSSAFKAVTLIVDWLASHRIEVLNVAGSSASKDPLIYDKTLHILTSVYHLMQTRISEHSSAAGVDDEILSDHELPDHLKTVAAVVEDLTLRLPLKDRAVLANMQVDELPNLSATLGMYIQNTYGLLSGNVELINSCRFISGNRSFSIKDAAEIIIVELWKSLKKSHKLRMVK